MHSHDATAGYENASYCQYQRLREKTQLDQLISNVTRDANSCARGILRMRRCIVLRKVVHHKNQNIGEAASPCEAIRLVGELVLYHAILFRIA